MNRLLYWTNLLVFFSTILACPGKRNVPASSQAATAHHPADTMRIDSMVTGLDSVIATPLDPLADTLSKEEKYSKGRKEKREAPDHRTPDESKLDSIKKAKNEKRKE